LNKRDGNELKNLITTPAVKYRRPYDVYREEYPHLASFMASVNGNDFMTDPG
jgi:predicted P-loop ATPase